MTTSQPPLRAQCSPSASPALALADTAGCIQTPSGKAAAIPLGCATSSLPAVDSASAAVGGAIATTPHPVVVDLLAAASLPVATQTGTTSAASHAQAGAGAVVAKAAARLLAKAMKQSQLRQSPQVTVHLVRRQSPLPRRCHLLLRRLRPQVRRQICL